MTTPHTSICALCWSSYEARTGYGLCPDCWSRDRLREWDRLESATAKAHKRKLPVTLTLHQWLATISDFKGRCAYCLELPYSFIETVDEHQGLTWENAVPICRACSIHKAHSWESAERRVQAYLVHNKVFELEPEYLFDDLFTKADEVSA